MSRISANDGRDQGVDTKTPITLSPGTNQNNYVRFKRERNNGVCFSAIGMVGREQLIRVDDFCDAPVLQHEIGHAVGCGTSRRALIVISI